MSARMNRAPVAPTGTCTWDELVELTGLDQLGDVLIDVRNRPYVILDDTRRDLLDFDRPGALEDLDEHKAVVRTRSVTRARLNANGTISVVHEEASQETGVNRRTQQRWWRWNSRTLRSITARPDGTWLVLKPARGGFSSEVLTAETFRSTWSDYLVALPEPATAFEVYPVLEHFYTPRARDNRHPVVDPLLDTWWTQRVRAAASETSDAREFTSRLFGKTRLRKDLVKAVAGADLSRLCMAESFRGLVPIDWIVAYLRRGVVLTPSEQRLVDRGHDGVVDTRKANLYPGDVRPLLRRLDQHSLRALLRDDDMPAHVHRDVLRMQCQDHEPSAPLPRCHSWIEVHDALVTRMNVYGHMWRQLAGGKKVTAKPVKHTDEALAFVTDFTLDDGRAVIVELAAHEDDLYAWGREMGHCIAGYGSQLRSRRSLLGAVHVDGRLVANFEVTGMNPRGSGSDEQWPSRPVLAQFLGPHNHTVPIDVRGPVVEHFEALGANVEKYWGRDSAELDRVLGRVRGHDVRAPAAQMVGEIDFELAAAG